jgi:hypothetical protein
VSELGDTKRVWHVIEPPGKHGLGRWWCYDDEATAQRAVERLDHAQMSEGLGVLSESDGGFTFWDVRRPEWKIEAASWSIPS